jgi:hypothetical protein
MSGKKAGEIEDSNPIRKSIRETLNGSDRPLSVGELAELFEMGFALMNYHLRVLHRASTIRVAHSESIGSSVRTFYEMAPAG